MAARTSIDRDVRHPQPVVSFPPVLTSPGWPRTHASAPPLPAQMDPKFLRNQRFSKKWMGKGRESSE